MSSSVIRLEFTLKEQDFVAYQLFTASQSPSIQKKKRQGHVFLSLGSFVLALFFYWQDNFPMTLYFSIVFGLIFFLYTSYFKWRYKRHYIQHVKNNYADRIGEKVQFHLGSQAIETEDKTGKSTVFLDQMVEVNETPEYFFLKVTQVSALIVPKSEIPHVSQFKNALIQAGVPHRDHTHWRWK